MAPVLSLEPAPIERLKQTVSASRLNCWLQCRLKFFFRYVLRIAKPKTAALHYGSVVHLVLQQWNMARWRRQAFDQARLKQVFEAGWVDQGGKINWDGKEQEERDSAWAVLKNTSPTLRSRQTRCPKLLRSGLSDGAEIN